MYDRPDWRQTFGSYSRPYRERYRTDPFSHDYVRHILGWYAQKHPEEDFAESFAVWLTPGLDFLGSGAASLDLRVRGLVVSDQVESLVTSLAANRPDVVFNIAESFVG